jgi:hypothetical protein
LLSKSGLADTLLTIALVLLGTAVGLTAVFIIRS